MTDRIKFAYLTYNDMLSKIESGEINEYDVIYSKDRYVTYLITETLEPLELRSRIYVFNSINEAENKLNEATDTYIGQIVSILEKDAYRGYIVNKKNDKFIVTPLYEYPESIDYTLSAGSVGTTELASNAVTTEKIADSNVTLAKLADDAKNAFDASGSASTAETSAKTYANDLNTAMDIRVDTLEELVGEGCEAISEASITALFTTSAN